MPDAFILGAGFSKAINPLMPTLQELTDAVITKLEESPFPMQDTLYALGNNIELWMTYLSQEQPWLRREHHHRNMALATDIRRHIRDVILESTRKSVSSPLPEWLKLLIEQWHCQRACVVSLNYDTLVERAAQVPMGDRVRRLNGHIYPPYFSSMRSRSGSFGFAPEEIETFVYYSIHGSTNLYYSGRDEFYGEPIYRLPAPSWGDSSLGNELQVHSGFRDKEPLIIPPVMDKLTYFNNETIRRLWYDASDALFSASRIFVIGYSLPLSDLGMKFFLQDSLPHENWPLYIIDKDSSVVGRFEEILPKLSIRDTFVGERDVVSEFVAEYPNLPAV